MSFPLHSTTKCSVNAGDCALLFFFFFFAKTTVKLLETGLKKIAGSGLLQ